MRGLGGFEYDTSDTPALPVIKQIILREARAHGLRAFDLTSKSRKQEIVRARRIAMRSCKRETTATLAEIGTAFNRGHSVVSIALAGGWQPKQTCPKCLGRMEKIEGAYHCNRCGVTVARKTGD